MKLDWPKTVLILGLAGIVGFLQFKGLLPPSWSAAVGGLSIFGVGALRSYLTPIDKSLDSTKDAL